MDKRTKGAWVIHHTKKLNEHQLVSELEEVQSSGNAGLLLSKMAASEAERELTQSAMEGLRKDLGRSKPEFNELKNILEENRLVDFSKNGTAKVLAFNTHSVLKHTSEIFEDNSTTFQNASLELSERISEAPLNEKLAKEYIADQYKLGKKNNQNLFLIAEETGIIDTIGDANEKVYFNGNLFQNDEVGKVTKILETLSELDGRKVLKVNALIDKERCITQGQAQKILGAPLLKKLQAVGMYEFNEVSNNHDTQIFVMKPSAFSKFGNDFKDTLDDAKAFISALYYGMTCSDGGRGQLVDHHMIMNTLRKLLRDERVGPCDAIGEDYQVLERRGVIQITYNGRWYYYMTLLKHDVGRSALEIVRQGDLADIIVGSGNKKRAAQNYTAPEQSRTKVSRKKRFKNDRQAQDIIQRLRSNKL